MASYSIISDVGTEMLNVLRKKMCPEPIQNPETILLCPAFEKGDYLLGLHLYDIEEYGEIRSVNMINVSDTLRKFPPLALTLSYMITVNSSAHYASKAMDEQRILGRVMQTFYDHPNLSIASFQSQPSNTDPELSITPHLMSFEDKMKMFSSGNVGSKLALFYKVSPVLIESTRVVDISRVKTVETVFVKKDERG